jgi:hypothetical protein
VPQRVGEQRDSVFQVLSQGTGNFDAQPGSLGRLLLYQRADDQCHSALAAQTTI